jgi:pseudouridine-5'-monophosphatase
MLHGTPIRGVIFDNDGTLVDSEGPYSSAHEACTGQPLEPSFKVQMMGKKYIEACQLTVDHCGLAETAEAYGARFARVVERHWATVPLMPGVMAMLRALAARGARMCIATGSGEASFRQKVARHADMLAFMDHCVTGDLVQRGKPAPDLFLLALARWGCMRPDEVLVFEDSPLGIEAATRAGMPAVFVPDPAMVRAGAFDGMAAVPVCTIASLEDFEYDRFLWAGAAAE